MALKFNLTFPMRAVKHYERWIGDAGGLGAVARVVENAGFDAVSMSEHPYPDREWLANGGHHAFDPFVSLSMMAAATEHLRVITYAMVPGYRSPYLAAKSAASLDLLSGGRLTLGIAAGYLETEFEALGADFGRRGKLLDEAIAAMRATWAGEEHHGPEYGVEGHLTLPGPAQPGGPPIWIGGNSAPAQRRARELADGWMPMAQSAQMAEVTRTPPLTDLATLRRMIGEQNAHRADAGKPPADISFVTFENGLLRDADVTAFCDALEPRLDDYADAGITWITIEPASRSFADFSADVATLGRRLLKH
ncbi:TIGR03619 family F420-dependent LLM class oxidoreductase [Streptomyces sp. GQFP]|uniref:TIGR03619 family F420-dependent LLM class oxidoreductase n=1 Tax=Streptomyces sp. GQFP TaxID=2907545 RepID=UPI001F3588F1|nr:TIGR03619 family F420-dependent LLM class oxidoreductase [Streptomyces sp. GQFP]UIX29302.1 TIGR03619 family F420-dependent LLM class oxidoreductase [Streptomyces sp. GQFP]